MKVLEDLQWLLLSIAFAAGPFERPGTDAVATSMIWELHLERFAFDEPWTYAAALSGRQVAIVGQSWRVRSDRGGVARIGYHGSRR
jgi:hypothetical protein